MGASWGRLGAAAMLLALALAPLPLVAAGTAASPEVNDPAGDQQVSSGPLVVPGVNDAPFDDVDVIVAYVGEFANLTRIMVQTTAGWTTGSMTVSFAIARGPSSLPSSTASGRSFTATINGSAVSGVAGATAATTIDGLRIDFPMAALGATGGDQLSNLTLATTRTSDGTLPGVALDDQTATDSAGPGKAYTFARPPVAGHLRAEIAAAEVTPEAGADGRAVAVAVHGTSYSGTVRHVALHARVSNDGLDSDDVTLTATLSDARGGALQFAGGNSTTGAVKATLFMHLRPGAERIANATWDADFEGSSLPPGDHAFMIQATTRLGASADVALSLHVPAKVVPPSVREVKPAGLGFLTGAAETTHLDGPFGSYAEAFLLGLIVLVAILLLFLMLALGRTTLAAEPASEAPRPGRPPSPAAAGPAGIMETVRAAPAPTAPPAEPEMPNELAALLAVPEAAAALAPEAPAPARVPAAAAGSHVRIEEVRHTPREPEAGQGVTTEVILRNEGPAAALRITLSVDGMPAGDRTVQVPSHATKAVELPWTAGAGDNRVRIQAFPA